MANAILLSPTQKGKLSSAFGVAPKSITALAGAIYGIGYSSNNTTLVKIPIWDATSNVTLSAAMTNTKDITNDGAFLYAVEERGSAAAANNNAIVKITSAGTATTLNSAFLNMRSVVYDPVNTCLYISCPYDQKIVKAVGGGIGGNTDTFTTSDFITGITNYPGRLWISKGSSKLFFTTEINNKQIGSVPLTLGVPGTITYFNLMAKASETLGLLFFDEFDSFVYSAAAGSGADRGHLFQLGLYSSNMGLHATSTIGQGVKLDENTFAYPDGTTLRYADISYGSVINTSEAVVISGGTGASAQTNIQIMTSWSIAETAASTAKVELRNKDATGTILAVVTLGASQSANMSYMNPIRSQDGVFVQIASGTVAVSVHGR